MPRYKIGGNHKKNEKTRVHITGVLAPVLLFLLLGVIGALMLFVPNMKLLYFCYVAGGIFLAYGALLVIRYFVKKEYEIVSNYDFSIGLILLVLGIISMIRAADVEQILSIYLGLMILIEGVILLQHTVQMKEMRGVWGVTFIFSIIFIGFSIVTLLNIDDFPTTQPDVFYGSLLGIISQIFVAIRSRKYLQEEELKRMQNQREEDEYDLLHAKRVDQRGIETIVEDLPTEPETTFTVEEDVHGEHE